jgi:hypothetical protein
MIRSVLLALSLLVFTAAAAPAPSGPPLSAAQRDVLERYITALGSGKYAAAFALLSTDERKYFRSAGNYASVFTADRFKIGKHHVLGTTSAGKLGVVVVVSEDIVFFDHAHQAPGTATARVNYGLINENGSVRVKDPYHPWRVVVPDKATAEVDKLRLTVRKISFFNGSVEFIITFANLGDQTVTLLPYGRSVVLDESGAAHQPIATKIQALTDRQLYLGLRLPTSGQYTGALSFDTPKGFRPKTLTLSEGKNLSDGGEAPFSVDLPPIAVGP